ncbi:unnamed protein product [Discula destructiva]
MRSSTIVVISLASLVTASPQRTIYKRCESSLVSFHYNNTEIGSVSSCATDVMDRGSTTPGPNWLSTRHYETMAKLSSACTDGPVETYTVVRGDTLEKIAAEFSTGVCNIAEASGMTNADFLDIDQVLAVPTDVCEENIDNDTCRTNAGVAECVTGGEPTYTIASGDTFFQIAAGLGITLDSLTAANPSVDPGNLQIDQVIVVPVC